MGSKEKIVGSVEAWESGVLGQDERHAIPATSDVTRLIEIAILSQQISDTKARLDAMHHKLNQLLKDD